VWQKFQVRENLPDGPSVKDKLAMEKRLLLSGKAQLFF
jgi:hypothetical protein